MDNLPALVNVTPEEQALIEIIRAEIEQGKARARQAMEQETKITYWKVGAHIREHLLHNKDRADYGTYLYKLLSENLAINRSDLYRSVQLYNEYPEIVGTCRQLTWGHLRVLVAIPEKQVRQAFEEKIVHENLSVTQFKELIKRYKRGVPTNENIVVPEPNLSLVRGKPWTYRLRKMGGQMVVDLGFRIYIKSPLPVQEKEAVVQVAKENKKYHFTNQDSGVDPHYTYKALLVEVVDGDTVWLNIDLGFNTWTTQKIRLRGIDAFELGTSAGQSAKDYVVSRLKGCKFLAVKTYGRDKFTRYLVDIFYAKQATDFERLTQKGKFLNEELLDKGLAEKY